MMRMIHRFSLEQKTDEQGRPEEFTPDLSLIVEHEKTAHLGENGLAPVGLRVYPGMCLIGKLGARLAYSKDRLPNDMESLTSDEATLISKYSHMFYDGSLYVPSGVEGEVVFSNIEKTEGGNEIALVEVSADEIPDAKKGPELCLSPLPKIS
jgi:DNA-directed RNA polymerase beta subunit